MDIHRHGIIGERPGGPVEPEPERGKSHRHRRGWIAPLVVLVVASASAQGSSDSDRSYERRRSAMVEKQILARGIHRASVLSALRTVPRHSFVPEDHRHRAYDDRPLPIGWRQTISQPYIVALMTELLELEGTEKVLEIGTGSGYHAAVLSRVAREVFTIEIIEPLAEQARRTLSRLGYDNVHVRLGDGYQGWSEEAPFDAIVLTAAPPHDIPRPLIEQLKVGGKLVVPLGDTVQDLQVISKTTHGLETRSIIPVRFVPMTGKAQEP